MSEAITRIIDLTWDVQQLLFWGLLPASLLQVSQKMCLSQWFRWKSQCLLESFSQCVFTKKIMKQCSFVFQLSLSMITLKTTMLTCKKAKKQPSLVFQLFSRLIFNIFSVMCTLEKDTFYAHNPLNFNITCSNFNTTWVFIFRIVKVYFHRNTI